MLKEHHINYHLLVASQSPGTVCLKSFLERRLCVKVVITVI